jgi:hypothetical protein
MSIVIAWVEALKSAAQVSFRLSPAVRVRGHRPGVDGVGARPPRMRAGWKMAVMVSLPAPAGDVEPLDAGEVDLMAVLVGDHPGPVGPKVGQHAHVIAGVVGHQRVHALAAVRERSGRSRRAGCRRPRRRSGCRLRRR